MCTIPARGSLAAFDPARQRFARNSAGLVSDAEGLARYRFGKPARNRPAASHERSRDNAAGRDPFGRPAGSMHALAARWSVAAVEPVVLKTQGDPVQDTARRVCDRHGAPHSPGFALPANTAAPSAISSCRMEIWPDVSLAGGLRGPGAAARMARADASGGSILATMKGRGR